MRRGWKEYEVGQIREFCRLKGIDLTEEPRVQYLAEETSSTLIQGKPTEPASWVDDMGEGNEFEPEALRLILRLPDVCKPWRVARELLELVSRVSHCAYPVPMLGDDPMGAEWDTEWEYHCWHHRSLQWTHGMGEHQLEYYVTLEAGCCYCS